MVESKDHPFAPSRTYLCAVDMRHCFKVSTWKLIELEGEWGETPEPGPSHDELEGWEAASPLAPRIFMAKFELTPPPGSGEDWTLISLDDTSAEIEVDADDLLDQASE